MTNIKKYILKNKVLFNCIYPFVLYIRQKRLYNNSKKQLKKSQKIAGDKVFYLGIPVHNNLGDLAQGVCIRKWIKKNYHERTVVEIETNALVNTRFSALKLLKKTYKTGDLIIFQSGYTTTDLGGYADEMHRAVMEILPDAKMLMMPQTIYFKKEENKKRTSRCYNSTANLLFLARDRISYDMALEMFPDIEVMLFPDVVTTMIGSYPTNTKRSGIMFCCRDDGEKFYSDEQIRELIQKCEHLAEVKITDTTKKGEVSQIVKNAEEYIINEIKEYSKYKLVITDRYHGTILSLVAGTPVIIIRTTDHKVTTGIEWFKGVYDEYVYAAKDLEDAYFIAEKVIKKKLKYELTPYFEENYYDKLKSYTERLRLNEKNM